jgi:2-hydroxychromene-2-carboxylate isomerase
MSSLEFWFDFASTYSYLTAMRIERVCAEKGIALSWRPFLLGPLFKQQGWSTSPFNVYPVEGKYMWKEMERHARKQGLIHYRKPSEFPRNSLLAARVAVAAQNERWLGDFIRQVFRAEFEQDLDIGNPKVISEILTSLGEPAERWLERAQSEETKSALRARTEEAQRKEIFGAPSFIAKGELFWGNDRLEEACEFLTD